MQTMCPGQDTSFWSPGDIFEVPCGNCGYELEFFKDDASRRCKNCGQKVANPKLNLGCAAWCEHAKECLGYDPKATVMDSEQSAVLDNLVDALRAALGKDQPALQRALGALDHAEQIVRHEGGSPKVVLIASALVGAPDAGDLMRRAGLDAATMESVDQVLEAVRQGADLGTPEFRAVWDADRLATFGESRREGGSCAAEVEAAFRTGTGRQMAKAKFC